MFFNIFYCSDVNFVQLFFNSRILEFESDNDGDHSESLEVELWDCSGNQR